MPSSSPIIVEPHDHPHNPDAHDRDKAVGGQFQIPDSQNNPRGSLDNDYGGACFAERFFGNLEKGKRGESRDAPRVQGGAAEVRNGWKRVLCG
jgi:hypothetical protein